MKQIGSSNKLDRMTIVAISIVAAADFIGMGLGMKSQLEKINHIAW